MAVIHNLKSFSIMGIQKPTENFQDVNNFQFYIALGNPVWMKVILFSMFCTNHKEKAGSATSSIGCLATISNPCISI